MNYWHMQLEPDEELGIEKIKEILNKNLIGMGDWEEKKDGNPQQTSFQRE